MNWLNAAITALDTISEATAFLRGFNMDSEYIPLLALCLLAGGVVFWVMLIFAVILGGCRLVARGFWAVVDFMPTRRASGGVIAPRESKDDEVGPFILDPQHD